jgi:hypothetical protein
MKSNKQELIATLDRVPHGILFSDLDPALSKILIFRNTLHLTLILFSGIEVNSMLVGGELIAVKNREYKTLVLFSRGVPFYTELSGVVSGKPGVATVNTSEDLQAEIWRGEAIKVGQYWYRVAAGNQDAPTSVTLEKRLPVRDGSLRFDADILPLDGDLAEERDLIGGKALKHGVTNDVKEYWRTTVEDLKALKSTNAATSAGTVVSGNTTLLVKIENQEAALVEELIKHKQIPESIVNMSLDARTNSKKLAIARSTKGPKKRKQRDANLFSAIGYGTNSHIKGTLLESIIREKK